MKEVVSMHNEKNFVNSELSRENRKKMLISVEPSEMFYICNDSIESTKRLRKLLRSCINLNPYFDKFFEADVTSRLVAAYPYAMFRFTHKYEEKFGVPCFLGISDTLRMFIREKLGRVDIVEKSKRKSIQKPLASIALERTR